MKIMKVREWKEFKAIRDYINKIQENIKREPVKVDPHTGQINLKYNPLNVQEDYYL
jgi:hypothetical protein